MIKPRIDGEQRVQEYKLPKIHLVKQTTIKVESTENNKKFMPPKEVQTIRKGIAKSIKKHHKKQDHQDRDI